MTTKIRYIKLGNKYVARRSEKKKKKPKTTKAGRKIIKALAETQAAYAEENRKVLDKEFARAMWNFNLDRNALHDILDHLQGGHNCKFCQDLYTIATKKII